MIRLSWFLFGLGLGLHSIETLAAALALAVFWTAEYHPKYGRLTK